MHGALSFQNLLALDDEPARREAYRAVAAQVLAAPSLSPLFTATPIAPLPPVQPQWTDVVAQAVLSDWLSNSAIGWLRDDSVEPSLDLHTLLDANLPAHRLAADSLYHWALPGHCHHDATTLLAYVIDRTHPWGEQLAAWLATRDAADSLARLPPAQRAGELTSLVAKLRWLAPTRVQAISDALEREQGVQVGFRFQPAALQAAVQPALAQALHLSLLEKRLTRLCHFTLASTLGNESSLVEPEEPVPHLTETILQQRMAELAPPERILLGQALISALPLLRKAIGDFIEPTLRRLAS